ncbi:hypothetical protein LOZ61_003381 [Ophidiomyces ophidiicola]|nr:hypothetical protein LOZ61_003381 [Ophidiomyces ophidiicola]KAI1924186.1 hypothetical protein LOZ60_004867 [Ophidiomyces ophidiicola]KAI2141052.1 hypothetical protein LOZ27_004743 [Ophidiomyces ophidiicola]KAI2251767.1 hypothetical protein LOZ10_006495 [Ophidiomyces ophidiicola]KAI2342294.1 hypothetical protein LOY94_006803 [Ophidiomyces ophidiicola]
MAISGTNVPLLLASNHLLIQNTPPLAPFFSNVRKRLGPELSSPINQKQKGEALSSHQQSEISSTIVNYSLPSTIEPVGRSTLIPIGVSDGPGHSQNFHTVVFPPLTTLATLLIESLWQENWYNLRPLSYFGMIEMYGGKEEVTLAVLRSIPNEIRNLEGKSISVADLDDIQTHQDPCEIWPPHSGYLDYITDDRNPEYWRPYVGQASNPAGAPKYRSMNYIRLWSLPQNVVGDKDAGSSRLLLNNILETLMCRAFQSLPSIELQKYFGDGEYATTGLNILPPLLQGIALDIPTRSKYIDRCLESADENIRKWPSERKRQRGASRAASSLGRSFEPLWRRSNYQNAMFQACIATEGCKHLAKLVEFNEKAEYPTIGEPRIDSLLHQASYLESKCGAPLIRPFGSLKARLGVVLDHCPVNKAENNQAAIRDNITALPAALLDAGLSQENSLVWTFNLRQCFESRRGSHGGLLTNSEHHPLSNFHRSLIEASDTRIILLCGHNAESAVINQNIAQNETVLSLRGCSFKAYFETDKDKTMIKRIYVLLVASLAVVSRLENWDEAKEHAEIFRFAAVTANIPSLRGSSITTHLIGKQILLRYWAEKEGIYEPMTTETMDPRFREWFALKGIKSDNEIKQYEQLGKSLMRGAILLLVTLPACPLQESKIKRYALLKQDIRPKCVPRQFSRDELEAAKKLFRQFTGTACPTGIPSNQVLGNMKFRAKRAERLGIDIDTSALAPEPITPALGADDIEEQSYCEYVPGPTITENFILPEDPYEYEAEQNDYETDISEESLLPRINLKRPLLDPETQERRNLLQGKWFKGHRYNHLGNHYQIWALNGMLAVYVTEDDVNLDYGFVLHLLLSPPGTRHPYVYVTTARDDDPASRLAIKVEGQLTSGAEFTKYLFQKKWKEPMRINSIFDWLSGASLEQIAIKNAPRRYIYIPKKDYSLQTPNLAKFVGGGFTDGSLSEEELKTWKSEKAKPRKPRAKKD